MHKFAVIATVLVAIIFVILGNSYYQGKLQDIATTAQEQYEIMLEEQQEREAEARAIEAEELAKKLNELTSGLSSNLRALITTKYINDERIHMVAFGSRSLVDSQNEGITPWPELLQQTLNDGYGKKDFFEVETKSFGYLTSLQVLNEERHVEIAELQPDIILIEPFIWNDNGEVATRDTIQSLRMMTDVFKREIENVILFVQPAQPVHGRLYYPKYVEELKEATEEMGIKYMDHWQDWPDINDDELLLFTNEEHRMPNQEGHQLWSDSVAKFFLNN